MIISIERIARAGAVAAAALVTAAASLGAQTADARFEAFTGCWEQTANGFAVSGAPLVCVTPVKNGSAIEIASIDKGAVTSRDTLDAGGAPRAISKEGCAGTERAEWSADNRRVFVAGEVTCAGGLRRTSSRIVSITPASEWLDVESVTINNSTAVRATHFREISPARTDLPASFAALTKDRALSVASARTAAGSALDMNAVAEAVKRTDTLAVQAWIVERGARFTNLSAKQLVAMADLGIPGSVTDVMIGVSYPDHFALDPRGASRNAGNLTMTRSDTMRAVAEYVRDRCGFGMFSVWSSFSDPACDYYFGSRFGYGRYYGYNSFYGYSPFGYGGYNPFYYGGYYGGPVVIVRGSEPPPHGQVVKGRGYTCGSCTSGSSGATRGSSASSSSSPSTSGGGASSSGSSGGSSGAGSSSGSSSGGRTAVPRPPE